MRKNATVLMAALVLLPGCATDYPVMLQPAYPSAPTRDSALAKVKPPLRFTSGTFADNRADPSILVRFQERVYTHTLRARRPLNQILFEGLSSVVKNSGHDWSAPGANVRVDLQLLDIQASGHALPGVIAEPLTAAATSAVQARLDFVNARTGELIYSRTYIAADGGRSLPATGMLDKVTASIGASIVNLMDKVGGDDALAGALGKSF